MADRPIIFSAPMVRALLDGRKTQTRRLVNTKGHANLFNGEWADSYVLDPGNESWRAQHVRYKVGDRLYVREAWAPLAALTHNDPGALALSNNGFYRADNGTVDGEISKWRPSIHMPRWASRITLAVTDVRVQRLNDCSEEDAIAEGVSNTYLPTGVSLWRKPDSDAYVASARFAYAELWDLIHGFGAWGRNPWIVANTFTVEQRNIDAVAS